MKIIFQLNVEIKLLITLNISIEQDKKMVCNINFIVTFCYTSPFCKIFLFKEKKMQRGKYFLYYYRFRLDSFRGNELISLSLHICKYKVVLITYMYLYWILLLSNWKYFRNVNAVISYVDHNIIGSKSLEYISIYLSINSRRLEPSLY